METIKNLYQDLAILPQELRVVFQGGRGSFSEHALINFFGEEVQLVPHECFSSAYNDLMAQKSDIGIFPIENTLIGTIHPSLDFLITQKDLFIIADETLKIEHTLVGTVDSTIDDITTVYSQWPGLEQCRVFLDQYSEWETIPFKDTAAAAEYVKKTQNKQFAAISSSRVAKIYNLKILRNNIESNHHNYTRFAIVINKCHPIYTKWQQMISKKNIIDNVGWLVFSSENAPGALFQCLSVFNLFKINLHKIESRPIIGCPWEYQFIIELDLSQNEATKALRTLEAVAKSQHIVGMYHSTIK